MSSIAPSLGDEDHSQGTGRAQPDLIMVGLRRTRNSVADQYPGIFTDAIQSI